MNAKEKLEFFKSYLSSKLSANISSELRMHLDFLSSFLDTEESEPTLFETIQTCDKDTLLDILEQLAALKLMGAFLTQGMGLPPEVEQGAFRSTLKDCLNIKASDFMATRGDDAHKEQVMTALEKARSDIKEHVDDIRKNL